MDLCSDGHEEVCYEGRRCPACMAIDDRKDAEAELERALTEVDELKARVDSLEQELAEIDV